MAEDERRAGGELVAALSQRVRELQFRVAGLEADLAAAQKRVTVYEGFDATVQEAITAALRAAYDIRERADQGAEQVLEQAREERRELLLEIGRLRAERDDLQAEVEHRRVEKRRESLTVAPPPAAAPPRAASAAPADSQLRLAATEALRGVFKELVEEMRRATPAPPAPVAPSPPPAVTTPPAVATSPAVATASPAVATSSAAETDRGGALAPIEREATEAREARASDAVGEAAGAAPMIEDARASDAVGEAAPDHVFEPAAETDRGGALAPIEREATEARAARASDAVGEAAGAAPTWPAPLVPRAPSQPLADLELVVAPVESFPQLVELERRIQSLSVVRTIYVRDFRGGVATLAVGLRAPRTTDEFARDLGTIAQLPLRVTATRPNGLDLRIDARDPSIASA